jgi:hypothetical protein
MLSVACTMVSLFVVPFASAFVFSSLLVFSSLPSAAAYQCHIDNNAICPGICCQPQDPYQLLVGPTCHIQAVWFSSENGTWVWTFPTFRFSYYWDQESIMGGEATKPKKEEETTEVLTMHPSWESHVNEETNSGIFFSLLNIHISCDCLSSSSLAQVHQAPPLAPNVLNLGGAANNANAATNAAANPAPP